MAYQGDAALGIHEGGEGVGVVVVPLHHELHHGAGQGHFELVAVGDFEFDEVGILDVLAGVGFDIACVFE